MIPTPEILLRKLPDFRDDWQLIHSNQSYDDIVAELSEAHYLYTDDYDLICNDFKAATVDQDCRNVFDFCNKYLGYNTEPVEVQTSRSPAGIIELGTDGYGVDCKHYSLFCAGILDALARQGAPIDWCFRFCMYKQSKEGHVYVVVFNNDREIWIDPAPIAGKYKRSFNDRRAVPDKYFDIMALYRVSGVGINSETWVYPGGVGLLSTDKLLAPTNGDSGGGSSTTAPSASQAELGIPYFQKVFANQNLIPGAVQELAINPPIWYTVNGEFWPLPPENTVVHGYVPPLPEGLRVNYASQFMGYAIPADMPRPQVIDGKLRVFPLEFTNFTGDQTVAKLLSNNKVLLNILMSAMGALINSYSSTPYANNLPQLSHYILDLRDKDNFLEPTEVKTFFGYFLQGAANTLQEVGKLIIKFIGIIPRTAFLALIRLNVHGWANALFNRIQTTDGYNEVRSHWLDLGGTWGDFHDAITDGNRAHRILGPDCYSCKTIGQEPTSTSAAALLATAAPVIAALAALLKAIAPDSAAAKTVDDAVAAVEKIIQTAGDDPQKLADLLNKDILVTGSGGTTTVSPTVPKPPEVPKAPVNLWDLIKANPIPSALIGAGLLTGTYFLIRGPRPKYSPRRRA